MRRSRTPLSRPAVHIDFSVRAPRERNKRRGRVFAPLMFHTAVSPSRRILVLLSLLAFTGSAALVALEVAPADGARNSKVLGKTKRTPKPLCPKDCRATGSVTGFGVRADGKKALYRVPATGHIVAWSVEMSRPNKEQRAGFGELFEDQKFGSKPQAGIAVLKKKKKGSRYTLGKRSPIVPLKSSYGEKPIITLQNPLRVRKGRVIALTLPTWAPVYTDKVSSSANIWKASRKPGQCNADTVTAAKPHLRKGTTRAYGCKLNGERIMYWAYFVPKKSDGKN